DDTVSAFLAVGLAEPVEYGQPYNAGRGEAVSVADVVELVSDLAKCRKPIQREEHRLRPANSEVRALLADSHRLAADAGWHPEVSLREGLLRTVEWWRDRIGRGFVRQS